MGEGGETPKEDAEGSSQEVARRYFATIKLIC